MENVSIKTGGGVFADSLEVRGHLEFFNMGTNIDLCVVPQIFRRKPIQRGYNNLHEKRQK